jgi:hypothetical protein
LVPKGVFDQSIFEGMEGDDNCPPVSVQSMGQDVGEKGLEVLKLAIGGNSQGLKDAGGRMGFGPPSAARVQGFVDRCDQVSRCLEGLSCAAQDDGPGNRAAGQLFTVLEEQVRQVVFVEGCEQFGRRRSLRCVKPHVERTIGLKAKAAAAIGQLIRRKPKVEQDAVDPLDAELIEDFRQLGIAGLFQDATRIVEDLGRLIEHHRVSIESNQFSGGTEVFEENSAVTASSDRAIHHDQSRRNLKVLNDFPYQDGTVNGRATVSRGSRRIRHSGGLMNEEWKRSRTFYAGSVRPARAG